MRIQSIGIRGVGGIEDLSIPFDPSMNILCGPNGIGKTTVLEALAHSFSIGQTNLLKRHVNTVKSEVETIFVQGTLESTAKLAFTEFNPNELANVMGAHEFSKFILSLKTTRTFAYVPLSAVAKDTEKTAHGLWEEARSGVSLHDVKNWFVNRFLYSPHPGALTSSQLKNFELAKQCFSALNPAFSFSTVRAASNEILVRTPGGEIYYEYLSSGFKSCLSIMFGIIKEIEFRFGDRADAGEFEGVILIDELELHLHPEWQSRIAKVLVEIFPKAQFITTTHSPHVIQSAEPKQIVALEYRSGMVALRALPASKYGFKGWTIDEVLTDVMGMSDTRTSTYQELMNTFADAVDREDRKSALECYAQLDAMLHPTSHARKLLKFQLAAIAAGDADDQA